MTAFNTLKIMSLLVLVCASVRVCVSVSLASDLSEPAGHHRQPWQGDCLSYENASRDNYIDLNFIQCHTDLTHENNKCLIISETIEAMPIKFAMKIVRLKFYVTISRPVTWTGKHVFVSRVH